MVVQLTALFITPIILQAIRGEEIWDVRMKVTEFIARWEVPLYSVYRHFAIDRDTSKPISRLGANMSYGIHDYGLFVLSSCLLNITPGPDTLYILGRTFAQGKRAGIASVLGIATGTLVHTSAAAIGLSTLLMTSAMAFSIVKYLGATYLIYLGVKMLLRHRSPSIEATPAKAALPLWEIYRQGVVTNLLNLNVALFFLALLPQFIDKQSLHPTMAFVALGLTFVFTGTVWCLLLVQFTASLSRQFARHPGSSKLINKLTGSVFVALGLRLAILSRQ